MGFLTRALIPSKVRRIAHPVRAVKRTVIPRPVRQAQSIARSVANPVSAIGFAIENSAVRAVTGSGRRLPSGYSPAVGSRKQTGSLQEVQEVTALARYLDDLASVHEQEFPGFVNPTSWNDVTVARFKTQVAKELRKGIPVSSRSRRAAARAAVGPEVRSRLREMTEAAHALERNVPEAVIASLEMAFADNATPAIPIGCEGDTATVALVVRDAATLLGNQLPGVTDAGNAALMAWHEHDRNVFYLKVVGSDVVATAKEGFANAPGIQMMNLVVIRQTQTDDFTDRMDAVMKFEIPRNAIEGTDWSRTPVSSGLGDVPVTLDIDYQTSSLEPLNPANHPDIAQALEVVERAPLIKQLHDHLVRELARKKLLSSFGHHAR